MYLDVRVLDVRLRGPKSIDNTQYIPILAGLAGCQSSNRFQYLQGQGAGRLLPVTNIPVLEVHATTSHHARARAPHKVYSLGSEWRQIPPKPHKTLKFSQGCAVI